MDSKPEIAREDIPALIEALGDAKLYHRVVIQRFKDNDEDGEIARRGCPQIDYRNRKIKDLESLERSLKVLLDVQAADSATAE